MARHPPQPRPSRLTEHRNPPTARIGCSRSSPPPIPSSLRRPHVALGLVQLHDVLVEILTHEFHRLREVRDVPHLELGPVPQEENHVPVTEKPLDRPDLHDVGVHDLGHVLPLYARRDAYATVRDGVTHPRLSGPGGSGGDNADDGEDGDGGCDGLGDGGWTLVERFLGCEGCERLGGGCRCRLASLSLPSLGLGGSRLNEDEKSEKKVGGM